MKTVFITGGTGYIGSRLIKKLLARGHRVIALVRKGSERKLPGKVETIIADVFEASSFQNQIPQEAVFVQLLGVHHPSPFKKNAFKEIDLKSVVASADAASVAGVSHFIYLSVSMSETKIMKDFQDARKEGENHLISKGMNCSFIRPWYVLGPGHWWPLLLLPLFAIAEAFPSLRQKARAKALVTINQMVQTLLNVIESQPQKLRTVEIDDIRKYALI